MPMQRVRSKWAKTEALITNPALQDLIPDTRIFNRSNLQNMLEQYAMLYVKPVHGTFGKGVIRIEKINSSSRPYVFQSGQQIYAFSSFDDMYRKLLAVKKPKAYLSQQGIHLLKHRGRRFDLRVMVQKNLKAEWETTGMIGRLAHPRKIVTNYHSGGTPMPLDELFASHMPPEQLKAYREGLEKLGVAVAKALEKRFPRLKEIGVDIAVDHEQKPWILEVNTLPDPFIFRKLPNQDVFRRMYSYAVTYGRFRPRRRKI